MKRFPYDGDPMPPVRAPARACYQGPNLFVRALAWSAGLLIFALFIAAVTLEVRGAPAKDAYTNAESAMLLTIASAVASVGYCEVNLKDTTTELVDEKAFENLKIIFSKHNTPQTPMYTLRGLIGRILAASSESGVWHQFMASENEPLGIKASGQIKMELGATCKHAVNYLRAVLQPSMILDVQASDPA